MIKNYKVNKELGRGGMATVYLAHDNKFDTNVAVKVLNKEFVHNDNIRKRFLAEARNMFKMSHPNIIRVTDLIEEGETVAFVMEYIDGETIKDYLERKGKLNNEEIKAIFTQMLTAVGYVHEQGLIHRDIKPSNFMINPNGQVKLLDFGIAKTTDTNSAEYTQTNTSQQMGTPMYMSPEQVNETKSVTAQSDIYSLGVVLWQMVMGQKPYNTKTLSNFQLQSKIVTEKLSSTNSLFEPIIELATAKELKYRYKNCKEIKLQIENLQKQNIDNKIAYTNQDFEKTIVDNSKDNTFLKVNENKPSEPKPKADVPNHNTILFVILVIVVIIIGTIISNNHNTNGEEATEAYVTDTVGTTNQNSKSNLIDQDGNNFETVSIGGQIWTSQNLNVYRFRNGDLIHQVKTNDEWVILLCKVSRPLQLRVVV
jgi:serine/threonine protein kinase